MERFLPQAARGTERDRETGTRLREAECRDKLKQIVKYNNKDEVDD